jgi:hypothetical protein
MSIEYKRRAVIPPKPIDGSDSHTPTCCIIYDGPHEHFVEGNKAKYLSNGNK